MTGKIHVLGSRVPTREGQGRHIEYGPGKEEYLHRLCRIHADVALAWSTVRSLLEQGKWKSLRNRKTWCFHYINNSRDFPAPRTIDVGVVHVVNDPDQVDDLLLVLEIGKRRAAVRDVGSHPKPFPRGMGARKLAELQQADATRTPKYDLEWASSNGL